MEIQSFKINGTEAGGTYEAAAGELLKLQWDCPNCDFCLIYPYNWKVGGKGELEVYIYETMTLILRAVKDRDSVQKEIVANVSGGEELNGVLVSPSGIVSPGTTSEFTFDLTKTGFGYMDHGIGRIEGSKYCKVLRKQYGVYRYHILTGSQEIQEKEKSVKAGTRDVLELQRLKYVMMQNGNESQYELSWRVVNNDGNDVIIEASDHQGAFDKSATGHASFTRTGEEIVRLSIRCNAGDKGQIDFADIYPFEVK